jgi:hypothetical protein
VADPDALRSCLHPQDICVEVSTEEPSALRHRPLITVLALVAAFASLTSVAAAAPPGNDNYLSASFVNTPGTQITTAEVKFNADTREAGVQADLFAPQSSGGGAEPTICNGVTYGKTVWYGFFPNSYGTAELQTAGFDAVVAVYEFDRTTSAITRTLGCGNDPGVTEDVFVTVEKDRGYAVQIGGVGADAAAAAGDLQFTFSFFPDRDRDGIFDPLDRCPTQSGTRSAGGCPPRLESTATLTAAPTPFGIRIRSLRVKAPKGARVEMRCRRRCSLRQVRTAKTVSFSSLRGRSLSSGAVIEIRVTKANSIGNFYRYRIVRGNFKRTDRCLRPGSKTPRRTCR